MSMRAFGLSSVAVLLIAGVSGCFLDASDETRPVEQGEAPADGGWQPIAESPLQARSRSSAVWTGKEMLVVGGSTQPPCPVGADCIGPTAEQLMVDGAAYNPDTDRWRMLPDAPQAVASSIATWTGHDMVLLVPELYEHQHAATLTFDPVADRWHTLANPPPDPYLIGGVWTGSDIIYWQSEESTKRHDWSLDLASGRWTKIPHDPFASTFDRSYTWVGNRFIFTGLLTSGIDNDESVQDVYQVAEYSQGDTGGAWRSLPPSQVGFGDPMWFWHDDALVNPGQESISRSSESEQTRPPPGGQYDLSSGEWSGIAQFDGDADTLWGGCHVPPVGSIGEWVLGSAPVLVSLRPAATLLIPACGELAEPDVGVWTGRELLVWGGPAADYQSNLNEGLAWTPPSVKRADD
jgi:hypothetical protein